MKLYFLERCQKHKPNSNHRYGINKRAHSSVISAMLLSLLLAILCSIPASFATEEQLDFDSTEQQNTYNKLIIELRCLVCQNQNIADSNADLAKDLRNKTYELLKQGKTADEIRQFMRDRYGDFVLYAPPLEKKTWLLWIGPFVVLLITLLLVMRFIRQQSKIPFTDEVDDALEPIAELNPSSQISQHQGNNAKPTQHPKQPQHEQD